MGPDERALLLDAFDSNWIAPLGPHVDAFEREVAARVGVGHAAALSSGTAGLHLALELLGVGRGDRVVASTLTFAATINPVRYVGAEPVLIDSEPRTWNMDPELLAEELHESARRGRLPRAAIVVDLYGQCADWEPILEACRRYEVPVIEDAAEALGATWTGSAEAPRPAGSFGDLSVLSFNGNKIITTSGGGMLLADDEDRVARARYLATQARDPAPHYQHSVVGYNYRLSNLLAAVGRGQLRVLDERVAARRATRAFYADTVGRLPGIAMMPWDPRGEPNGWLTCLTIDPEVFGADREDVRLHLERHGVESRPVWKPMHLQPVFAGCELRGGRVADDLFARGLCLPSGSALTPDQRAWIAALVAEAGGAALP
jgi:pyridoxal phosphate-dependent aminotransferase EpsN